MGLVPTLTIIEAKKVLDAAKYSFDNTKGINEAHLINLARGVKGGLL